MERPMHVTATRLKKKVSTEKPKSLIADFGLASAVHAFRQELCDAIWQSSSTSKPTVRARKRRRRRTTTTKHDKRAMTELRCISCSRWCHNSCVIPGKVTDALVDAIEATWKYPLCV